MSMQDEIRALTIKWSKESGGRHVAVPVGAAFNIIMTCTRQLPPEAMPGVIEGLRNIADQLEAMGRPKQ